MIKDLGLTNFRSHKKTTLNFHEGVNVIVGDNSAGKTNLARALNWIINNKPSGDSFRSHWGGETKVTLQIDDQEITRQKTKSSNEYLIGYKGDLYSFKAFGQDIPEDISKGLNFSSINFQKQHDSPFLLGETPGSVARYLNEIINNKKIDSSQAYIKQKLRKKTIQIDIILRAVEENREDLKKYKWVKEVEIDIISAEKIDNDITDLKTKQDFIIETLESIDEIKQEQKEHNKILKYEEDVEGFFEICSQVEKKESQYSRLELLLESVEREDTRISGLKKVRINLETRLKNITPVICPLCGRFNENEKNNASIN